MTNTSSTRLLLVASAVIASSALFVFAQTPQFPIALNTITPNPGFFTRHGTCFRGEPPYLITTPSDSRDATCSFQVPPGANYFEARLEKFDTNSCHAGDAWIYVDLDNKQAGRWRLTSNPYIADVEIKIPDHTSTITFRTVKNQHDAYCIDPAWMNARFTR
jgi:hypothetical protein